MNIHVFSNIGSIIESSLVEPAQQIAESISGNLIPFVAGGLTIWVMVYAIATVRGAVHTPVSDFVWRIAKISLILYPGIAGGIFQPEAFGFYTEISNAIYNAISQGSGGACPVPANDPMGIYSALDCAAGEMFSPLINLVTRVWKSVTTGDAAWYTMFATILKVAGSAFLFFLMVCIALILTLGLFAYVGFEMISLRVSLALAFALSPLFIFALAFEPIKSFFSNWLNFVIKSIIFQALFVAFMGVAFAAVTNLGTDLLEVAESNDLAYLLLIGINNLFSFVVMMFVFIFVAARLPSVASELSGGGAGSAGLGTLLTAKAGKALGKWTGGKLGTLFNKKGGHVTGND